MDESFQELEAELKSLQLRAPSPDLLARLGQELAEVKAVAAPARPRYTTATSFNSWKWLGWRTAGLAAVLALAAAASFSYFAPSRQPDSTVAAAQLAPVAPPPQVQPVIPRTNDRYRPVAASNVLYDLKDEGPVKVDGESPARRLRYRYLDTYTWKNQRGNASLKWSVPRDEIRVIPASMN